MNSSLQISERVTKVLSRLYLASTEGTIGIKLEALNCRDIELKTFTTPHPLIVMIDFIGDASGFISISLELQTVATLLDLKIPPREDKQYAEIILLCEDFLRESLNGVSGSCLNNIQKDYKPLTLMTPKVIHGSITCPLVPCVAHEVQTKIGLFYFCVSIDTMHTDISRLYEPMLKIQQQLEQSKQNKKVANYQLQQLNNKLKKSIQQAQKMASLAATANQAKASFLANMSHEIRTPLNGIIAYTEILLEDQLREDQRNHLSIIMSCSDSLLTLINDILDLSKIESETIELESIASNLENILYESCDVIRNKAFTKDLELIIDTNPLPNTFFTDPTRLKQVIINLLANAVKFTHEGEIIVSMTDTQKRYNASTINFSVQDSGIGMSEKQLEVIFDAFQQADESTTRLYGGTGLGLTICKKLVEAMGSELKVESKLGIGTTFSFEVSLKNNGPIDHERCIPPNVSTIMDKKILLAESNQATKKFIEKTLKAQGISYQTSNNTDDSLTILLKQDIDIIIIEYKILCSQNNQLQNFIHSDECKTKPHIIIITNTISLDNTKLIDDPCIEAYLTKPIRPSSLLKTMLKAVQAPEKEIPFTLLSQQEHSHTGSLNILLAEDNKVNQILMKTLFTRMGHYCKIAENGLSALKHFKSEHFDLIFMDMQMPEMDGLEATIEIRKIDHAIPIIALTANAFKSDRKKCFDAGMNEFMTKPVKQTELRKALLKFKGHEAIPIQQQTRIMLVDDDHQSISRMKAMIKKNFPLATLRIAENGAHAYELLGSYVPHIIISDIHFSDMNAYDFLKFIRYETRYSQTKIIVMKKAHEIEFLLKKIHDLEIHAVFDKNSPLKTYIHAISHYIDLLTPSDLNASNI
ncbi:MAG: response regulator [Lentisphaeraceae bacterium]|nr:response regulator [Lentisphaeraceae bacterium]